MSFSYDGYEFKVAYAMNGVAVRTDHEGNSIWVVGTWFTQDDYAVVVAMRHDDGRRFDVVVPERKLLSWSMGDDRRFADRLMDWLRSAADQLFGPMPEREPDWTFWWWPT